MPAPVTPLQQPPGPSQARVEDAAQQSRSGQVTNDSAQRVTTAAPRQPINTSHLGRLGRHEVVNAYMDAIDYAISVADASDAAPSLTPGPDQASGLKLDGTMRA
jgi:hypothetical protein